MDRFERGYGVRRPLHLLALLVCFALSAYAVLLVSGSPTVGWMAVWFAAAVVAHDLVLFPIYSTADRTLRRARVPAPVALVNHIRVPALAAGLLFLLFLPGILQRGSGTFRAATGQTQDPFPERFLLVTAGLFVASGIVYAVQSARTSRRRAQRPSDEE